MLIQSYLNLRKILSSSEPRSTIGDDIEILFDQMKNGKIQETKRQHLLGYYMLSEEELEKLKEKDQDFLQTIGGTFTKNIKLDGTETLFFECKGMRTTFS